MKMSIGSTYRVVSGVYKGSEGVLVKIRDDDREGGDDFYKYYLDLDGNPDDSQGFDKGELEAVE